MKLRLSCERELPCLAWCAKLSKGSQSVNVRHGEWVETRPDGFVEGAWDGNFTEWRFDDAVTFMGSGGRTDEAQLLLSTPTHTLERIFAVRIADEMWLSNSLPFCLSSSNTELDPAFAHYQAAYHSTYLGIDNYISRFPLKEGHFVSSYVFCNLSVDKDLTITRTSKQVATPFSTYAEYTHYLSTVLTHLLSNAQDGVRTRQYRALATASSGYDSAAVAALAFEAGCKQLFTFANGRPENQIAGPYQYNRVEVDDSGEHVAAAIGYEDVLVRDRWEYLDVATETYEAETCASGALYYDPVVTHEQDLRQTIFLTGHFGDVIWSRSDTGSRMEKGGHSGASLSESRLRIGFIHAPVSYVAATSLSSIVRIANSDEMLSWQLNNEYDRPIPRRILEERNVPRESFGMTNRAANVDLQGDDGNVLSKMSPVAARSFSAYYAEARKQRRCFRQLTAEIGHALFVTPVVVARIAKRFGLNTSLTKLRTWRTKKWWIHWRPPRAASYLFPWGVNTLNRTRYRHTKR